MFLWCGRRQENHRGEIMSWSILGSFIIAGLRLLPLTLEGGHGPRPPPRLGCMRLSYCRLAPPDPDLLEMRRRSTDGIRTSQ